MMPSSAPTVTRADHLLSVIFFHRLRSTL
jgi:hypothetical protein